MFPNLYRIGPFKSLAMALHGFNQTQLMHPDFPFQPRQVPLFYGWVILGATTLGTIMSIPGQTAGVSVFTDYLIATTGLSRLALSNAYLIGTLTSGLLLPFGGVFIDLFGARLAVIGAAGWLALTLAYLSLSSCLAEWISSGLAAVSCQTVAFVVLCLGFVSLRFSGQGMLTMISRTTLGKWFDRRRGMVSGIAGVFASFGFSAAPLLLSLFIEAFGWREAWLGLAILVGVGMGSIGWIFYRDNPEECGLVMDGRSHPAPVVKAASSGRNHHRSRHRSGGAAPASPRDFTRAEALKTLAFWAVTLALATQALTITAITFHIVDIGATAGISQKETVALFLPIAGVATLTGYAIGVVSDRLPLKRLFIGMMVAEAVGVASMAHLDSWLLQILAIVGIGISGGCFGTLSTVTMPRYFGRRHLGAISGVEMMTLVIASAVGPTILALFNVAFGSYQWGLYLCAGFPLATIFILLPFHNPQGQGPVVDS